MHPAVPAFVMSPATRVDTSIASVNVSVYVMLEALVGDVVAVVND